MDGVAERVEDRADLVVDGVGQGDGVEGGEAQVFGEGAGLVDADAAGLGVEVEAARARTGARSCRSGGPRPRRAGRRCRSVTSRPSATISPANSWPMTIGVGTVRAAQSSHCQMWMSVPQMPVLRTWISTSSGPIAGSGTSSQDEAGAGASFTRAFISAPTLAARRLEGGERLVEVGVGQGGRHLRADAGAALGDDGVEEAGA